MLTLSVRKTLRHYPTFLSHSGCHESSPWACNDSHNSARGRICLHSLGMPLGCGHPHTARNKPCVHISGNASCCPDDTSPGEICSFPYRFVQKNHSVCTLHYLHFCIFTSIMEYLNGCYESAIMQEMQTANGGYTLHFPVSLFCELPSAMPIF